ncbi:MAG: hypothetical protein J7L40_03880 [Candidatus Marinimicrobia bacterium]|nr:hypothetical protein [Candidatus Neomarinimicrobiota bacterium]
MAKKFDPNGFLSISEEVANIYMLFFADVVSKRRNISKLTDNGDMFAVMHYFANDANFNEWIYNEESAEVTSSLVISTILAQGVECMHVDKIIEFRKNTVDGRTAFRGSIDKLVSELCSIEDETFKKDRIVEYQTEIENNNKDIIPQAGSLLNDFKYSILTVGLPTSMTALALLAGAGKSFDLTQIGSSCFIGAVSALADSSRTKRKRWKSADTFYYHQMEKVFGSEKGVRFTIPSFHSIFEEFIND